MKQYLALATLIFSPLNAVHAGCNQDAANRCGLRYWSEQHALNEEIGALSARQAVLPALIGSANERILQLQGEYNVLSVQGPLHQTLIEQLSESNATLVRIRETLGLSRQDLVRLPRVTSRLIPGMVARLRLYLSGREALIAQRVNDIDAIIRGSRSANIIEALLFERRRLLDLQVFERAHETPEEARIAIATALGSDAIIPGLTPETQVLLREAHDAIASALTFDNAFERVMSRFDQVDTLIIRATAENAARISLITGQTTDLGLALVRKGADIMGARAELSRLNVEYSSIPGVLEYRRARNANAGHYWHCCDNQPFCDIDRNRGAAAYEEAVFNNDGGRGWEDCR